MSFVGGLVQGALMDYFLALLYLLMAAIVVKIIHGSVTKQSTHRTPKEIASEVKQKVKSKIKKAD